MLLSYDYFEKILKSTSFEYYRYEIVKDKYIPKFFQYLQNYSMLLVEQNFFSSQ